jgi:hypothetical protein
MTKGDDTSKADSNVRAAESAPRAYTKAWRDANREHFNAQRKAHKAAKRQSNGPSL